MKTKWKLILGTMAGLIILAFPLLNLTGGLKAEVIKIEPQTIANTFLEEGKVIPELEVPIYALNSQEIVEVSVKEGQEVKKGDILAILDTKELDFQLKQLQGQLISLIGEEAKTRLEQYEGQVKSHELSLKQAQLELTALDTHLQRIKKLYQAGAATKRELEDAENAVQTAIIDLEQEEEALRVLRESYKASGGSTQYYTGRQETIEAQIEHLKYQIERSTVLAPLNGVVANLLAKKGNLSQIGVPLMTIFQKDSYLVEVFLLTEDVQEIKEAMAVNLIYSQKDKDISFSGLVKEISPTAVEKLSALGLEQERVKVTVDFSPEDKVKVFPGYRLDVEFITEKQENQLVVPKSTLFMYHEGYALWIVKDGKAKIQPIEKGFETSRFVALNKGLEKGDLVILNPQLEGLKEGKKIKPYTKDS